MIVDDFVITIFYNHASLVVTLGDFSYDKPIVQRLFKQTFWPGLGEIKTHFIYRDLL